MTLERAVQQLEERMILTEGVELPSICDFDGWISMCGRLQNGRPQGDYLRIYRNTDTGCPQKTRNKDSKKSWDIHAKWAWDTMCQTASAPTSIGFYSQSFGSALTCWGALDFDLHCVVGNENSARLNMFREALVAFQRLTVEFPSAVTILENSGRGFHVLLILEEPIPISTMFENMKCVSGELTGVEILPSPRISTYGKPLRAPGTWNPAVDQFSRILGIAWPQGITTSARFWLSGIDAELPERDFFLSLFFRATRRENPPRIETKEHPLDRCPPRKPDQIWIDFAGQYFIQEPKTRHRTLLKLVGECFYQYGTKVILRFAELQFEEKSVSTEATKEEHLEQAKIALDGMHKQWLAKQANLTEARIHNELSTVLRKDAFRILHNFAKYAEDQSQEEFYVSHKQLAERLNVTKPGAAQIFDLFEGRIIQQTRKETAMRSRRYVWLIS